ncbi:hypothetical protein F383_32097 [Gossypium arboreum]|uniref:Uncharacterized protein n=1 Tax=Gossypium arboreum TaxID=29729 RepID=A0A0B0N022_GOSAR|nr:hypothetical protein F383_32097 [Gossypium arboreum]
MTLHTNRSCTPNVPAFDSLSIRIQAFTYIKVYKSRIHNLPSTQDLGMSRYERHKRIDHKQI